MDADALLVDLWHSPHASCPSWPLFRWLLDERRRAGARMLFEGAQGALLDVDHGTYPYVTSSNTVAGQAATGSGMGPGQVGYVLGIAKAIQHALAKALSRPNSSMRSAAESVNAP